MLKRKHYDRIIVGGGFFGCILGATAAGQGEDVVILEKEDELLSRASYANQARVHNGYHYPRSVLTALRSRVNFPRFCAEYKECIVDDFEKLYAIPRQATKVSASQFRRFMERIGAPIRQAPAESRRLFCADLIEDVFSVTEYAFDALKLRELSRQRLIKAGAEVATQTTALRAVRRDSHIEVWWRHSSGIEGFSTTQQVVNCTYSQINRFLQASALPLLKLKHELTEMALIAPPPELQRRGITVMCGPFFSTMPFPPRGLHTLSHVRYTPHCHWHDRNDENIDSHARSETLPRHSAYAAMVRDASRFLPCLRESVYKDSIWEVKTVLPQSETDDSRPILFRRDYGMPGLTCIMGGKIDNVFDAIMECHPHLPNS